MPYPDQRDRQGIYAVSLTIPPTLVGDLYREHESPRWHFTGSARVGAAAKPVVNLARRRHPLDWSCQSAAPAPDLPPARSPSGAVTSAAGTMANSGWRVRKLRTWSPFSSISTEQVM